MADTYGGSSILTALVSSSHPARIGKQADLVRLLCEFGAKPNGVKDDGMPLRTAIIFRYTQAAEALANCGAQIDNVVFAAALNKLDVVKQFLQGEIAPFTDAFGLHYDNPTAVLEIALKVASMADHLGIVKFLLQQGIDINAKSNPEEGTPLHEACHTGQLEIARYLLANGADITSQDRDGMTPLHWAAWHQHLDLIDLLVENNAPLKIRNTYGGTVLDATIYGLTHSFYPVTDPLPTLQKLVAAGADVMAVEPYPTGNTTIDEFLKSHRT